MAGCEPLGTPGRPELTPLSDKNIAGLQEHITQAAVDLRVIIRAEQGDFYVDILETDGSLLSGWYL